MTKPGASLFYFGLYVLFLGMLFLLRPNLILSFAKLPAIAPGWARIIGLLAAIIGVFDMICGKRNMQVMLKASVWTRLAFALGIVLLVVSREMPFQAIGFALVDTVGALLTAILLQADKAET